MTLSLEKCTVDLLVENMFADKGSSTVFDDGIKIPTRLAVSSRSLGLEYLK
jgi:hypothetical protein